MGDIVRTFISIDIKPEMQVVYLWAKLRVALKNDSIKWVDSSAIHLTILFLGDTPVNQIRPIASALSESLGGISSFRISIKGVGTFGKPNPKVVWLGVDASEELNNLKQLVDKALVRFGYEDENKTFSPHLTLGRIKFLKSKMPLSSIIAQYRDAILQKVHVSQVILYQSVLTPQGPVYKPLETITLRGD